MARLRSLLDAARPSRVDELIRLDEKIRSPLPLSTRVGFVGVSGGIGCSTAAGLASVVLSSRRPGRVLAVNASGDRRSLLWHAGLTTDAHVDRTRDANRAGARRAQEVTAELEQTAGGLSCVDLIDTGAGGADARWWEVVAPIGRFFDFVVTDWGVRDASSCDDVTASSALACVTTTADRHGLQRGVDLAHALTSAGTVTLLAVVDARRRRDATLAEMIDLLPVPAVLLPHDAAHGATAPARSSALRPATTLAAMRLSAALVQAAAEGRTP